MNIKKNYRYQVCLLIKKILDKNTQSKITFTYNHQKPKYNLRRASHIALNITPRTNQGKRTIDFEGAILFNNLPKELKQIKSAILFKKCLKTYIFKT